MFLLQDISSQYFPVPLLFKNHSNILGGDEHAKESYQVLVADANAKYEWISSSNGEVPNGAIQGGHTSSGEPLYIGRIVHDGVLTTGKIHPSHGVVYVPYASKEHGYGFDYEILVAIE